MDAFVARIASMGPAWREQVWPDVRTNRALGEEVVVCLGEKLTNYDLCDPASKERMSACLYVLQLLPVDGSIETIDKLAMSAQTPDAIRLEALVAMCKQSNGINRVRQKLNVDDDGMRAAAVRALARVQGADEIKSLLSDLKQRKTDFTGTYIGIAISEAQNVVDISKNLFAVPFDDQLTYLLGHMPYQSPPPPARPQLGQDPASVFVWNRLVSLWEQDPAQVRKVAEKYKVANPDRARWVDQFLGDLPAKAK